MNTLAWLQPRHPDPSRQLRRMEAKLDRHAGLLLWTFSPIVVSGLALHQPDISNPGIHLVGRSLPIVATVLLAAVLVRRFIGSKVPTLTLCRKRTLLGTSIGVCTSAFQRGLVCASGACLALFVLCLAHRHFGDGFEWLAMAVISMIALGESCYVEAWAARPVEVKPVFNVGRLQARAPGAPWGAACMRFGAWRELESGQAVEEPIPVSSRALSGH